MVEYKKCTGECYEIKELCEENFYWRYDTKKYGNMCKICTSKNRKIYNINNNEKIIVRKKIYYKKHREEIQKKKDIDPYYLLDKNNW